jgi:hypothetical protein
MKTQNKNVPECFGDIRGFRIFENLRCHDGTEMKCHTCKVERECAEVEYMKKGEIDG